MYVTLDKKKTIKNTIQTTAFSFWSQNTQCIVNTSWKIWLSLRGSLEIFNCNFSFSAGRWMCIHNEQEPLSDDSTACMEGLPCPCPILTTCAVWLWDPYLWTARPAAWPGGCPACSGQSTAGGTTNTGGCETVGRRRARRWTGHARAVWQTHLALDSCGKFLCSFLEVFF